MWRILFRILILVVYMDYIISLIVFPFKISESPDKSYVIRNDLHSTVYLGDSKQLTDLFYYSEEHLYFIDHESCKGENFFIKNFSEYNTSHYTIDIGDDYDEKAVEIKETIYLYRDLDLEKQEKIEDFPFLMKLSTYKVAQKGCVLIGILYRTDAQERKINFIEQLKKRDLISRYAWTFKYKTENEGIFIIGGEPHTYDPEHFNESYYFKTEPQMDNPYAYGWIIQLDKLYIGENLFPTSVNGRISFSNNYILSDEIYNKTIYNTFFKKYIENDICFYNKVSFGHSYYCCHKNNFTLEDMRKLPTLKMTNLDLELNFTFTGEELFYEAKDYYIFKLNFMENSQGGWILGQLFLRKYQLVFDHDAKTIGYYNNFTKSDGGKGGEEGNGDGNTPSSSYKIYLYIIIPLTVVVLAAIIFVLIKLDICGKKRKKLVNELDDEDNEDYFNINSDKNQNKETNEEDRKLYKSSE